MTLPLIILARMRSILVFILWLFCMVCIAFPFMFLWVPLVFIPCALWHAYQEDESEPEHEWLLPDTFPRWLHHLIKRLDP